MEGYENQKGQRMIFKEGELPELKKERAERAKKMVDEYDGFFIIGLRDGSNKLGNKGIVCEINSSINVKMVPAVLQSMDRVTEQLMGAAPIIAESMAHEILEELEEKIKAMQGSSGQEQSG